MQDNLLKRSPTKNKIDEASGGSDDNLDEGDLGIIESKSFAAKVSKFQSSPNKIKNKVVIVDEEEEGDFTIHTSINNHVSFGTQLGNVTSF